ncbi:hypothetical protein [Streptomyces sp. 2-1]|uniref:hypothetical protein n=1 Tax=Streptomyces sp. 2-1 TaxID=412710 RepID=UPI003AFACBC1
MDRELNIPTIGHLVSGPVSVSSKFRPAVSGSGDGVGITRRSTAERKSGAPDAQGSLCCWRSAVERTRGQRRRCPRTGREKAGGSFMRRVLAQRVPHRIHVPARLQMKERAQHDGPGQRDINRRRQVPHTMVINGGRWRDEEDLHALQATAAS